MSQAFGNFPTAIGITTPSQFVGIHPNNYQGTGDTEFSSRKHCRVGTLFQIADTVSPTRGRQHMINLGGDFRRQILNFFQLQAAQER